MDNLKETESFGANFKDGEDTERFFARFQLWIERSIFSRISKRINFLLTRVNNQKFEIIADGNTDKDQDDNWRHIIVDGDLKIQKRINGTWTTSRTYSG